MFTGIIEEIGRVKGLVRGRESARLSVEAKLVLADTKLGDSIAVNGVCLTVDGWTRNGFVADVMAESLERSTLGTLSSGKAVNLERALAAGDRLGGHLVSGHVDGRGKVLCVVRRDNAVNYRIGCALELLRYISIKGSIAIDGVSLTVTEVDELGFSVALIPHSLEKTVLKNRRLGDAVNLENDQVAKHVERLLMVRETEGRETESKIDLAYLGRTGFI
jgi:riboflavin synthase